MSRGRTGRLLRKRDRGKVDGMWCVRLELQFVWNNHESKDLMRRRNTTNGQWIERRAAGSTERRLGLTFRRDVETTYLRRAGQGQATWNNTHLYVNHVYTSLTSTTHQEIENEHRFYCTSVIQLAENQGHKRRLSLRRSLLTNPRLHDRIGR